MQRHPGVGDGAKGNWVEGFGVCVWYRCSPNWMSTFSTGPLTSLISSLCFLMCEMGVVV